MQVYRICNSQFSNDLSGEGAKINGGRWNSKGTPIIYTSSSIALATLEVLVHFPINIVPNNLVLVDIDIPESLEVETIDTRKLKKNWRMFPASECCPIVGDEWVNKSSSAVLRVPSAIIQRDNEFNLLLNPMHDDFNQISIKTSEPFLLDSRILS